VIFFPKIYLITPIKTTQHTNFLTTYKIDFLKYTFCSYSYRRYSARRSEYIVHFLPTSLLIDQSAKICSLNTPDSRNTYRNYHESLKSQSVNCPVAATYSERRE
jgi:hypothetical protein